MLRWLGPDCLIDTIIPGVDALLAKPSWRFEDQPQDFRHNAATRDHVKIRGNGAVAISMRVIDLACGEARYTATPLYAHLSEWLDGMRAPMGGYYGCQDRPTDRKCCGQGTPAQFIPLWWILGGLAL